MINGPYNIKILNFLINVLSAAVIQVRLPIVMDRSSEICLFKK